MPRLMFLWLSQSSFHMQLLRGSTYSHVGFASCIHSFSNRVNEVTANSKIAHFHLPLRIDQHVRGLYICKKEHIPQSLSCMGGCAKPKTKPKSFLSAEGTNGARANPCASCMPETRLAAGIASSGDCLMGLSYVLQVSLRFQTLLSDLGEWEVTLHITARSHCAGDGQGHQSAHNGNSRAGLGASPEDVCKRLDRWQVSSWIWSHASKRKNPWGKDEGWAGKGEEEQGLQEKEGAVN